MFYRILILIFWYLLDVFYAFSNKTKKQIRVYFKYFVNPGDLLISSIMNLKQTYKIMKKILVGNQTIWINWKEVIINLFYRLYGIYILIPFVKRYTICSFIIIIIVWYWLLSWIIEVPIPVLGDDIIPNQQVIDSERVYLETLSNFMYKCSYNELMPIQQVVIQYLASPARYVIFRYLIYYRICLFHQGVWTEPQLLSICSQLPPELITEIAELGIQHTNYSSCYIPTWQELQKVGYEEWFSSGPNLFQYRYYGPIKGLFVIGLGILSWYVFGGYFLVATNSMLGIDPKAKAIAYEEYQKIQAELERTGEARDRRMANSNVVTHVKPGIPTDDSAMRTRIIEKKKNKLIDKFDNRKPDSSEDVNKDDENIVAEQHNSNVQGHTSVIQHSVNSSSSNSSGHVNIKPFTCEQSTLSNNDQIAFNKEVSRSRAALEAQYPHLSSEEIDQQLIIIWGQNQNVYTNIQKHVSSVNHDLVSFSNSDNANSVNISIQEHSTYLSNNDQTAFDNAILRSKAVAAQYPYLSQEEIDRQLIIILRQYQNATQQDNITLAKSYNESRSIENSNKISTSLEVPQMSSNHPTLELRQRLEFEQSPVESLTKLNETTLSTNGETVRAVVHEDLTISSNYYPSSDSVSDIYILQRSLPMELPILDITLNNPNQSEVAQIDRLLAAIRSAHHDEFWIDLDIIDGVHLPSNL